MQSAWMLPRELRRKKKQIRQQCRKAGGHWNYRTHQCEMPLAALQGTESVMNKTPWIIAGVVILAIVLMRK